MTSTNDLTHSPNTVFVRPSFSPSKTDFDDIDDDDDNDTIDEECLDSYDEIENILQTFGTNDYSTSSIDYYDSRRYEIIYELMNIERQFDELKTILYEESVLLIDRKLISIQNEEAPEYQDELKKLYDEMKLQLETAKQRRQIELQALENVTQSELLSLEQTLENDKFILYDRMREELEEQIHELETLKVKTHLCTNILQEMSSNDPQAVSSTNKRRIDSNDSTRTQLKKRRLNTSLKPVEKDNLAIFYQLSEINVLEDWAIIQSSLQQQPCSNSDESDDDSKRSDDHVSDTNQFVLMPSSDYFKEEQI